MWEVIMGRRNQRQICVMRPSWSHRAFTLIELLVVVAIIVLLLAMLLPNLAAAREQGKRTVCITHQRSIAMGFNMYAAEWDDRLPGANWGDWSDQSMSPGTSTYVGGWLYTGLSLNMIITSPGYDRTNLPVLQTGKIWPYRSEEHTSELQS